MLRLPAMFIENETNISSPEKFNITFDTIKGNNISYNFYDLILYKSLTGQIYSKKNGLKIKYYDETNNILSADNISKFNKIQYDNKIIIENINIVNIKQLQITKYITRIEIIFTYNNNDILLFNSNVPQYSPFSEKTLNIIKHGIAIPEYSDFKIKNTFKLIYK